MLEVRELGAGVLGVIAQVDAKVVRWLDGRLVAGQDGRAGSVVGRVEDGGERLKTFAGVLPQAIGFARGEAHPVEERPISLRRGPVSAQVDHLLAADGFDVDNIAAGGIRDGNGPAGIAVAVLGAAIPDENRVVGVIGTDIGPDLVARVGSGRAGGILDRHGPRKVYKPRPRPAAVAVELADQRAGAAFQPVDAGKAVLGPPKLDGRIGKRRRQGHDAVAVGDVLIPRVALVQGLGPEDAVHAGGVLPLVAARAGVHAADRRLVAQG